MSRLKHAAAGLAVTVVLLTGCGADGDDAGASGSDPAATDGSSAVPTAEPSEDASTGAPSGDGDGFCADVEAAGEAMKDIADEPDLTDLTAALRAAEDSLDAIRNVDPPAEIAEDWATVVSYLDAVSTGLKELDASDPATLVAGLEDLGAQLEQQSAAFDEAGTRIEAYLSDECGVVLE